MADKLDKLMSAKEVFGLFRDSFDLNFSAYKKQYADLVEIADTSLSPDAQDLANLIDSLGGLRFGGQWRTTRKDAKPIPAQTTPKVMTTKSNGRSITVEFGRRTTEQ